MFCTSDTDPIKTWIHLLKQNKLPSTTIDQLAQSARQWLKLLSTDPQLTPALARNQVWQEITDAQTQEYFARYFFALFLLLRESALTN